MTLRIPNVGELELLRTMLSGVPAGPLTLRLYVNDWTPGNLDITASYQEMAVQGYTPRVLAPGDWTFHALTSISEATHTTQVWTFTGGAPCPIYGYYIVGADGILRWAERFSPVYSAEIAGDVLRIIPKITFSTY